MARKTVKSSCRFNMGKDEDDERKNAYSVIFNPETSFFEQVQLNLWMTAHHSFPSLYCQRF